MGFFTMRLACCTSFTCGLCMRFTAHALDQRIYMVPVGSTCAHCVFGVAGYASDFLNITRIIGYKYFVVTWADRHGVHLRLFFRFGYILAVCVQSDEDLLIGNQYSRTLYPWAACRYIPNRTSQCVTVNIYLIRDVCRLEVVAVGCGIAHMPRGCTRCTHGSHACVMCSRVLVNRVGSGSMVAIGKGGVRTGSIGGVIAMVAEAVVMTSIDPKAADAVTHSVGASAHMTSGAVGASTHVTSCAVSASAGVTRGAVSAGTHVTSGAVGASASVTSGAVSAGTRVIPVACGISHAVKSIVASAVSVGAGAVTCHPRAIVRPGVVSPVGGASANPVEMANMQTISTGIVSSGLGSGFVRRRVVRGSVVTTCGSHQSDTCDCWNEPFLIHWNTSYTIECPQPTCVFVGILSLVA